MTENAQYHNETTTTTTTRTTTTTGSSTGSTTGTGARARSIEASVLRGFFTDAMDYYTENFRRNPTPAITREIAETIRRGMTGECLMAIIDEAMAAPRPSWAYCRAIIRRCEGSGIRTLADWEKDRQRYENSKNPALQYSQRTYTEQMFDESFFVNLDEYRDK